MREQLSVKQPHAKGDITSRLLVSLLVLAAALSIFFFRQDLLDRFTVWQFKPTAEVSALATSAGLSEKGKFYYYASRPAVQDREVFNASCNTASSEQTAVLGCYVLQRMYIFNVTDPQLNGIKEVTAAHEMLHAVYDRLSPGKRTRVDALVNQAAQKVTDPTFIALLKEYEKTEPGERLNELHSIIGTQIGNLDDELESYYGQYFTDRNALVRTYDTYQQVFGRLKIQQDQLVQELDQLNQEITAETSSYNQEAATLNNDIELFNSRAENGTITSQATFNTQRNELMSRQQELQQIKASINTKIATYNEKRQQLIVVNSQAETLNRNINSNLNPVPSI